MSGNNTNVNERRTGENEVPDEIIDLPQKVYNANWRDDVPDEAEDEMKEVTSFEPFEDEQNYKSGRSVDDAQFEARRAAFTEKHKDELGRLALNLFRRKAA